MPDRLSNTQPQGPPGGSRHTDDPTNGTLQGSAKVALRNSGARTCQDSLRKRVIGWVLELVCFSNSFVEICFLQQSLA